MFVLVGVTDHGIPARATATWPLTAGPRHGAPLRLSGAPRQRAQCRTDTTGSACRAYRQRMCGPGRQVRILGIDRAARTASVTGATCKCDNSYGQTPPSRGTGWCPGGKSTGAARRGFTQVTGCPTPVHRVESGVLPAAPAGGRCPIRTHVRRPIRLPLLYFTAVLGVRTVLILLLACGAMGIRTPDLLHAMPGDFICQDRGKSDTRTSGHLRCLAGSGAGRSGLGA
jgi:hypothetical protein